MGVDGISKADIFDEYFDDDKPKVTNFEKIKAMDIDEMARWLGANTCNYCVYQKVNCDDIKQCKDGIKLWLESEARE